MWADADAKVEVRSSWPSIHENADCASAGRARGEAETTGLGGEGLLAVMVGTALILEVEPLIVVGRDGMSSGNADLPDEPARVLCGRGALTSGEEIDALLADVGLEVGGALEVRSGGITTFIGCLPFSSSMGRGIDESSR